MTSRLLSFSLLLIALLGAFAGRSQTITISADLGDTICYGSIVTFTATPSATGSYGYIWRVNGAAVGTSTNTYTDMGTLTSGSYVQCILTNAAGDTTLAVSDTLFMVIDSLPAITAITGPDSVCLGDSIQLADATPGGVWSSTNPASVVVSPTGMAYGIALPVAGPGGGPVRAIYKLTNGCGSDSVRFRIRVNVPAGPIVGQSTVCLDSIVRFTDTARGGLWTMSDTTILGSPFGPGGPGGPGGIYMGLAVGTTVLYYNVANACGSYSDSMNVSVINCDTTSAVPVVTLNKAINIFPNPNQGTFTVALAGYSTTADCAVYNLIGEKVASFTVSPGTKQDVNISMEGLYFVTITSGTEKVTSKVVVTR